MCKTEGSTNETKQTDNDKCSTTVITICFAQPPLAGLPRGVGVDVPASARGGGLRGRDPRLQRQEELHGAQGRPLRLQPLLQAAPQGGILYLCKKNHLKYGKEQL